MQIKKRLSNAINLITLLCACIIIFVATYFFSTYQDNLAFPIAKNATWVIRIDAETLLRQEAYNALLGQKDDQFIEQLQSLLKEDTEDKSTSKLFINLKEDFVLYSFLHDKCQILALALKTTNHVAFNENISQFLNNKQVGLAQNENAIIFLKVSGKKINKSSLTDLAQTILTRSTKKLNKENPDKNEFMAIQVYETEKQSLFSKLDLSMQFQDEKLILEGETNLKEKTQSSLIYGLKHEGLYIASNVIIKKITDSILHFLPSKLNHFKEIKSFALDFQGTYLEDPTDSLPNIFGFLPTPIMNMVVQTKEACDVKELWAIFPEKVREPGLKLNFGNVVYTLKQLEANYFFVGVNPESVTKQQENALIHIQGKLKNTINIQGSTFVTTFIENMRPVKAANEFLSNIENIDLQIEQLNGNNARISGEFLFKQGKHPIHELTKLAVSLKSVMN